MEKIDNTKEDKGYKFEPIAESYIICIFLEKQLFWNTPRYGNGKCASAAGCVA